MAKTSAPHKHGYTQTMAPEPSFRRGVASAFDIGGRLFKTCTGGRMIRSRSTHEVLRADRARLRRDVMKVRTTKDSGAMKRVIREVSETVAKS
jgi:hypothetical protein